MEGLPFFKDRRFCSDVFDWISRHQLLQTGERVLLAVSGGLDSMVLLDFFERFAQKKYGVHFAVAHLDHQIRPESVEDARWLQKYCEAKNLEIYLHIHNVLAQKQSSSQSSLEAIAREIRYQWLVQIALRLKFDKIVTAHSASDQLETLLMRLTRGSTQGLGGMRAQQSLGNFPVIRPLLSVTREAILAYAQAQQLLWREDASNQDPQFFRNRVRQTWVPLMKTENPQIEQQISRLCEIWADENDWLNALASNHFQTLFCSEAEGFTLDLNGFMLQPVALQRRIVQRALAHWLGEWKIYTSRHIDAICELTQGDTGKYLTLPEGLMVAKTRQNLRFSHQEPPDPIKFV